MNSRVALKEQDQHIGELAEITGQLHQYALNMNEEIKKQGDIAEDLDVHMDKTTHKMNFVQKKLSVLLKTNDHSQLCTIMILTGILMILILLVVVL